MRLSEDQRVVANCAMKSNGDRNSFLTCAGATFLNRNLGPNEQAVLNCAANARGDASNFAGCSVGQLPGGQLSREQRIMPQPPTPGGLSGWWGHGEDLYGAGGCDVPGLRCSVDGVASRLKLTRTKSFLPLACFLLDAEDHGVC